MGNGGCGHRHVRICCGLSVVLASWHLGVDHLRLWRCPGAVSVQLGAAYMPTCLHAGLCTCACTTHAQNSGDGWPAYGRERG